jgi:outer membrane protein assembly factor BamA
MVRPVHLWLCVLALTAPAHALAQTQTTAPPQTREEALRLERQEKQQSVEPYTPNALQRGMRIAEEQVMPLLFVRDGLHLKFGSLATGSGFAFGGGYRHRRLFEREGSLTAWAATSLKKYWAVEGRFDMPDLAGGKLEIGSYVRWQDYPQEVYFGLGPAARRGDETNYQLKNTLLGGRVGVKPAPVVTVGGGLEYSRPVLGPGRDSGLPSIETIFDDTTAPGLFGTENFFRTSAFLHVDYRQPRNARRGGWYRVEASHFADAAQSNAHSFNRVDVDLRQFASVLAERRVIALRLYLSTSEPASGARVPFYLMPTLGGHDSLRGFRDYRFRGPHAILTNAEYRWEIWSGLDAALFYDAGKVAFDRSDLNFKDLAKAYGFGFRFNTDNGTILRIDAGFGSQDGKHLYIVFGDVF